jgi:hypothetical protein
MQEGTDVTSKELLVTVTPELMSKVSSFRSKSKESQYNLFVVKGFEAKTPVEPNCLINKYESIFKTAHHHAISK